MSKELESKVWLSSLPGDLKPLAAIMADLGNDSGRRIHPSIAYLAWKLSRSERCVQDSMGELKRLGIVTASKYSEGGRGIFTHYHLHADKLPTRPPWTRSDEDDEDEKKGADSSPFPNEERVQLKTERVQFTTQKGAESAPKTLERRERDPLEERDEKCSLKEEESENLEELELERDVWEFCKEAFRRKKVKFKAKYPDQWRQAAESMGQAEFRKLVLENLGSSEPLPAVEFIKGVQADNGGWAKYVTPARRGRPVEKRRTREEEIAALRARGCRDGTEKD